jgi:DNA polymerase-3 subunit beta
MEFKAKKEVLQKHLNIVRQAIDEKSPVPAYANILIEVRENEIIFQATNGEIEVISSLTIENDGVVISSIGSALVPAIRIAKLVASSEGELFSFLLVDSILHIDDGKSTFGFNCYSSETFPVIENEIIGSRIAIESSVLKKAIEQTKFQTNKDIRKELNGVNLLANANELQFVGTDMARVVKKVIKIKENVTFNVIVPFSSLEVIKNVIPNNENINLVVSDRRIAFVFEKTKIYTRLIDLTFPPLDRIFNTPHSKTLDVQASNILIILNKLDSISDNENSLVKLSLKQGEVVISSANNTIGNGQQQLDSAIYVGDDIDIYFKLKYLLQAIKVLEHEQIAFFFEDFRNPSRLIAREDNSIIEIILHYRY